MLPAHANPAPPPSRSLARPSVARVYDYYLGGTTNWIVDRDFGDHVLDTFPQMRKVARANRIFLDRVVRFLTKRGIRQFLDVGSGVPAAGCTHRVADELAEYHGREPDARVVYVDNDPVAVAHAQLLLDQEGDPDRHAIVGADLRDPDDLWQQAVDTDLLDPDQPVALLLVALLHIEQPDASGIDIGPESVARLYDRLPAGSYVAVSHMTNDGVPGDVSDKLLDLRHLYAPTCISVNWRSHAKIEALLDDLDVVEPGWQWVTEWRPEETGPNAPAVAFPSPAHAAVWAGVGQKPY